jgi:predicted nucleotidyltransferase
MDLTTPAASVLPALRARILAVLARTDTGLTGRRVAVLAGGSPAGVAKILESLVSGGVVHRLDAGSASLYTLNHDHVGAPAVVLLAGLRAELFARMRRALEDFRYPPLCAVVYGSAARGDGSVDSDVDLLLVRPGSVDEDDDVWTHDTAALADRVLAWSGNTLSIVEYSPRELHAPTSRRRAFLARVDADGVVLHGPPIATLLRRTRVVRP